MASDWDWPAAEIGLQPSVVIDSAIPSPLLCYVILATDGVGDSDE